MRQSDKLPHFPAIEDPIGRKSNNVARDRIASQMDQYLQAGGTIKKCTSADNQKYNPHRTRAQVIADEKRKMIGVNRFKKVPFNSG